MKLLASILAVFLCLPGLGAEKTKSAVPKRDREAAAADFKQAMEYEKQGKTEDALMAASQAAELDPANPEYVMARETLRQQIVSLRLDSGNRLARIGDNAGAAAEFRRAIEIDPGDTYPQQRLRDVSPAEDPEQRHTLELLASVDQITLRPQPGKKNLRLQGDARMVYTQIGQAFGVYMTFDQSLTSRPIRADIDSVDFYTATAIVGKMLKTFWAPVASDQAIVANDTQENRRQYERLALRTFYVNNFNQPADLNDVVNIFRTIFEMKFVSLQADKHTITVRAPREQVEAAASLIDNLMEARPELLLDVQEFEYDADKAHNIGLNVPTDFQVFNIPSEIRRVLGPNAQPVIDQLNQTGTIDPSKINPSDLSNLENSPLIQPFLFFGKGLGLTGFTVHGISGTLSASKSFSLNMEHVTLRATDGEAATFRVGSKFPILSGTFTNVGISNKGQAVIGSTPQFQYTDLGLTLKATPHYLANGLVRLDLEFEITGIGTASLNNIPDLTSRSYKANITVREGEPSVLTGLVTDQELRSARGWPGLGQIPVLKNILSADSKDRAHNEIMIIITPHVLRKPFRDHGSSTIWTLN